MTGWGGGNPDAATAGPDAGHEMPEHTCPKCGRDDVRNLPPHMRACTGGDGA